MKIKSDSSTEDGLSDGAKAALLAREKRHYLNVGDDTFEENSLDDGIFKQQPDEKPFGEDN